MSAAHQIATLTLEEFMMRPPREDGQREELIHGELIVSPLAKARHGRVVDQLREALRPLRQQGFVIMSDTSVILRPDSMPGPDLYVVREERYRDAEDKDSWLDGSPELVIEVASPSNRSRKLALKAAMYLDHGAEQVWTAYPKHHTIVVQTSEETHEARSGESVEFHGVVVSVDYVFSR